MFTNLKCSQLPETQMPIAMTTFAIREQLCQLSFVNNEIEHENIH